MTMIGTITTTSAITMATASAITATAGTEAAGIMVTGGISTITGTSIFPATKSMSTVAAFSIRTT
jgi:hypothetical protein